MTTSLRTGGFSEVSLINSVLGEQAGVMAELSETKATKILSVALVCGRCTQLGTQLSA